VALATLRATARDSTGLSRSRSVYVNVVAPPAPAVVLTGSALAGLTVAQVVAGGKTITAAFQNAQRAPTLGQDNAETMALLAGLTSNRNDPAGWNAKVKPLLRYSQLVLTVDGFTLTLPPVPGYAPTSGETVTWTIPDEALV
jgi:hypothetical protein